MLRKALMPFLLVSSMAFGQGLEIGENHFEFNLPYFQLNGKVLTQVNRDVANKAKSFIDENQSSDVLQKIEKVVLDKKYENPNVEPHNPLNGVSYNYFQTKNNFNLESIEIVINYRGHTENLSYNIDPKTGDILKLDDIFTEEGVEFLKKNLLWKLTEAEEAIDSNTYNWNNIPIIFVNSNAIFNVLNDIPSPKKDLSNYTYTKEQLMKYLKPEYK